MHNQQYNSNQADQIIFIAKQAILHQNYELAEEFADRLFQIKAHLSAIKLYQEIIEKNIQHDYKIAGLGNNEQQIGYYEWNSYEWYKQQKQSGMIKGTPYDGLSLCCLAFSKYEAGIAWYKQMSIKYPSNYQIIFGYANILYNNSIYEQAIKNYELCSKLNQQFIKCHVDLALLFEYRRIQKRKSIQKARYILQRDKNNQYALFILARNENDIDKKIIKLIEAWICNEVGICYGGTKKQYEQAIKWYQKCTKINPKYSSCYNNIGVNNQLLKKYQQAQKWYFRGVQADNQYKTAYKNLTDVFDQLKYDDNKILQRRRQYLVGQDIFCYYIGLSYYDKSKTQKSIEWIQRAIKINCKQHRFYNSLAISYDEIKNYDKAIQNYLKCIEIQPNYFSAYYNLAIVYKAQDKQQDAIRWYIKATQINPRYSYAYNNLGNIYKKRQDYNQAIRYYTKAIEFNSTYTLAYINLGVCHLKLQQYKQAYGIFLQAQQIYNTDNNNLSESNKQFIKPHLSKFELQGQKWRRFGLLSLQSKYKLEQIKQLFIRSFQYKQIQLQININQMNIQLLQKLYQLLNQNNFEIYTSFQKIFLLIQKLYLINQNYFKIFIEILFIYYWKKQFIDKYQYQDIQIQIQNTINIQLQNKKYINQQIQSNYQYINNMLNKYKTLENRSSSQAHLFGDSLYFTHYQSLLAQIMNLHQKVIAYIPQFTAFVQEIKLHTKSITYKITTRIPFQKSGQFAAALGVFQQIFKYQLGDGIKSQITAKINQYLLKPHEINIEKITDNLSRIWMQQLTNIILKQRIINNQQTYCKINNFIEGTILFENIKQLLFSVDFIHKDSQKYGFEVFSFSNKLFQNRENYIQILLIKQNLLFSLILSLKSNYQHNRFLRQVQKIQKSPFGSIFACLIGISQNRAYSLANISNLVLNKQKQKDKESNLSKVILEVLNKIPSQLRK